MKYILLVLYGLFFCGGDTFIAPYDPFIEEFDRLKQIESNYDNNALSRVGAVGMCQITTNLLSHYNWVNRDYIRPSELTNERTNITVGQWYLGYLDNFFSDYDKVDRDILKYSSYNMGQYRTTYNKITNGVLVYRPYTRKIVGIVKYARFHHKNKLIWRGKRVDLYQIISLP